MTLVAGIDSSIRSCTVVIRDADTGALVRSGRASHPDGAQVHPDAWWQTLREAIDQVGGLDDVVSVAIGAQQHGLVCLDAAGEVLPSALLWDDKRSAAAAEDLVLQLGAGDPTIGAAGWAKACGSVPVATMALSKLRWFARSDPDSARRVAAVCLPHDWLTWRLAGHGPKSQGGDAALDSLVTERSDASSTGYWSPVENGYRSGLLALGFGRSDVLLPLVLGPYEVAGYLPSGALIGPGVGDSAAAALGLGLAPGDVSINLGTSGVISAVCPTPVADASGLVSGFADATGGFLPQAWTRNAGGVIDAAKNMLGVDIAAVSNLALSAPAGADGLMLVPYFEGERTPTRPFATASLLGMTLRNTTPATIARAFIEALLCGQADGLDALMGLGVVPNRIFLIGAGAALPAVCQLAPGIFGGREVIVPASDGEYVADGAARQAAWVLTGADEPPAWQIGEPQIFTGEAQPTLRERYASVRELTWSARP